MTDRLTFGNTPSYSRINTTCVLTNAGTIVLGVVTSAIRINIDPFMAKEAVIEA